MIQHDTLTNKSEQDSGSMIVNDVDLGTMVINEDDDGTMEKHGTSSGKYRPEFLDHFDQKEKEKASDDTTDAAEASSTEQIPPDVNSPAGQALQKQLQQIAGVNQNVAGASNNTNNPSKFQQCIAEGDLEFLKYLSHVELTEKMSNLDQEMEREIDDLRRRYHAKRQPILDAMDQKRKRQ